MYDAGDVKLVVRWFFNDSTEAIYQWIPASDNRYVAESISGYFDFDFRISEDRFTRYRALKLRNEDDQPLPAKLAGKYSCVISSIMSQDSRSGQLVIYSESPFFFTISVSGLIFFNIAFFFYQFHQLVLSLIFTLQTAKPAWDRAIT